jgi:hypothetical protein
MPFVKPISGHTKLGAAQRYLEREGRALARDFLNLDAPMAGIGEDGLPEYREYDWASIMDETREKLGNDSPFKGRKARTYKHYVFSPDPRDAVSLSQLRSVTMSWVEENFGDYEVAVVYHDDNEHHIPHAHVIVNNTNLVTGRRLQDPDPRAMKRSAQRIAREHGLSFYEDEPRDPVTGAIPDSEAYARRNAHIVERDRVARGEYSWVGDIRARVDVAKGIAKSPEDFRQALREMGVNVRESASRKGDWVYSLAGTPSRQVTGSKLGASYTKREVTGWLRSPTRRAPGPVTVRNVRVVAAGAIEVKDLRELVALSEAVSVVSRGGFRSLSAMDSAASRMRGMPNREATVARLERARQYCSEHGILPEKSMPQPNRRSAGSPGAHGNHRTDQENHSGSRPARQQTRRDERPGR